MSRPAESGGALASPIEANDRGAQPPDGPARDRQAAANASASEQERLKFIFESMPIGVSLVLPGPEEIHFMNPAHEQITGISAAEQRNPDAFRNATHPADLAAQEELVRKYKRGEIDRFTIEKRYVHRNGRIVWASLTRRMFMDPATGQKQSITTAVDITDRKDAEAKLAETYKKLADASRRAGMAEIATGVLHNVGNVVNSVNVSATLVSSGLREMKIDTLEKVCGLLRANQSNLAEFLGSDPKGQRVVELLESVAQSLQADRDRIVGELGALRQCVEHINEIVAMQQAYAMRSGLVEALEPIALMEDALRMNAPTLARCEVSLQRDFAGTPSILAERGKVLQILINLIRNAKHACNESGRRDKRIRVAIVEAEAASGGTPRVHFVVEDNGVGIPPENLTRIFNYGFTTRAGGHGFGLHSSVLAAREMNGDLHVESAGPGAGAKFTLQLPVAVANAMVSLPAA